MLIEMKDKEDNTALGVGGRCDKRRVPAPCQFRMDIVLRKVRKEGREIAKLCLRRRAISSSENRWPSRCWTLLGLHLNSPSAASGAERLRTVEERYGWFGQ